MANYNVSHFDSPEQLHAFLASDSVTEIWNNVMAFDYFDRDTGDFYAQLERLKNGDNQFAADAQKLIDEFNREHVLSVNLPIMQPARIGFIPNVPAALIGHPKDMFNRVQSEMRGINTPLSIVVDTTVSSGVSHDEIIKRGTCVLAFALAMQSIRPISLRTISLATPHYNDSAYGHSCRIPTNPVDLARASFMLCHPGFARAIMHTSCRWHAKFRGSSGFPFPFGFAPTEKQYSIKMRELMQLSAEDVFIPGGYLFDTKMRTNPLQWVKDMIAKHTQPERD